MLARNALSSFKSFLKRRRVTLRAASPRVAAEAMLAFFRDVQATDCDPDADGDMLLFQWGTYDCGHGRFFECDITRQFITADGEDDEIWQLSFTIKFRPTDQLSALGSGNRWCHSRDDLAEFTAFVLGSPAFHAVADSQDGKPELDYECAG
jgi:hypothetical protein